MNSARSSGKSRFPIVNLGWDLIWQKIWYPVSDISHTAVMPVTLTKTGRKWGDGVEDLTARLTEMGFENFLFLGRYKDGRVETSRYGFRDQSFVDFYTGLLASADAHKGLVDFCRFTFLLLGLIISAGTRTCAFCGAQVERRGERYFPSCRCQLTALQRMLQEVGVSVEDFLVSSTS